MPNEPTEETTPLPPSAAPSPPTAGGRSDAVIAARSRHSSRSILAAFELHTQPAAVSAKFGFLPPTRAFRELASEPASIADALQQEFSEAELLDSGLFERDDLGEIRLKSQLESRLRFTFVYDGSAHLADVVTDDGYVISDIPPCVSFERDQPFQRTQRFYLGSARDLQVLSFFGMRGTVAAGLERLTGAQLRRLLIDRVPAKSHHRLTLVGWDVAELRNEMPLRIKAILNRFCDAAYVYELEPDQIPVDVWQPSTVNFDRICAATTFADAQAVKSLLKGSVGKHPRTALSVAHTLCEPPPLELCDVVSALQHEISRARTGFWQVGLVEAEKRYRQATERLTGSRYLEAAQSAKSPEIADLWMQIAEASRDLQNSNEMLTAAAAVGSSSPTSGQMRAEPADAKERDKKTDRFLKLLAAVHKLR
jgi:hypothetical protein